ncbi:kinase-like domain-containing protein [Zychaea mexicana]|uniref:kinase-like domain-containing protein n=1 Tax=Zychaea mexicana TaxID=64656 RepID=UPI0022FDEBC2|nr:kinase-like domain-containing protein [Zychaea mexicana]KAI9499713.1 kinase-like domain-containing protein [Zychaea mexicana]
MLRIWFLHAFSFCRNLVSCILSKKELPFFQQTEHTTLKLALLHPHTLGLFLSSFLFFLYISLLFKPFFPIHTKIVHIIHTMPCPYPPPSPATTTSLSSSFKVIQHYEEEEKVDYDAKQQHRQHIPRSFLLWRHSHHRQHSSLRKTLGSIFLRRYHHCQQHSTCEKSKVISPPTTPSSTPSYQKQKYDYCSSQNKKAKASYSSSSSSSSNNINNNSNENQQEKSCYNSKDDSDQYTDVSKSIGVGSYADVRLVQSKSTLQLLAIKTFRKRPKGVPERKYMKQIAAEYCIASSLDHPNIVRTFDLGKDPDTGRYFTVMEYCADGDLCTAITVGKLRSMDELHCYFKQLLQGLEYLHDIMGIAHRDIKPENLLLHGHILKITDFGVADVMRDAWQTQKRHSYDLCGTTSYVAPELYTQKEYRGDKADMWSAGIVYYVMRRGEMLFASAKLCDSYYRSYLRYHPHRQYSLFNNNKLFKPEARDMMYRLLDPDPSRRYSAQQLLRLPWIASIPMCCQNYIYHEHTSTRLSAAATPIGVTTNPTRQQLRRVMPIIQQQPPSSKSATKACQ